MRVSGQKPATKTEVRRFLRDARLAMRDMARGGDPDAIESEDKAIEEAYRRVLRYLKEVEERAG